MNNSMLEYKGYHAVIKFDAEDDLFTGEVFGIADSLNFHGQSVDELKKMFKQSIDNYLQLCEKIGKEPDKEYRGTFNVRISPGLHKRVALEALKKRITLNQYVTNALEKSFETNKAGTTIIYTMPYYKKNIGWQRKEKDSMEIYCKNPIIEKKESLVYARH